VVATAHALLKQRGMPAEFWGEAVIIVVHLLNWSPTKSLEGKTPYEAWHGHTPTVVHLYTFNCLVYVKDLNAVNKLSDRSTSGMFIGYAEGIKAYRILDPVTRCVRTVRVVIFDEGHDWSKETNGSTTASSSKFTIDYAELEGFGGEGDSPSASGSPAPAPKMPTLVSDSTPPTAPTTSLDMVARAHPSSPYPWRVTRTATTPCIMTPRCATAPSTTSSATKQ
jgi:hypothetical protein